MRIKKNIRNQNKRKGKEKENYIFIFTFYLLSTGDGLLLFFENELKTFRNKMIGLFVMLNK